MKKLTDDQIREMYLYLKENDLVAIPVKKPSNIEILSLEFSGNLVVIKLRINAFSKLTETTRVYKKVQ